MTFKQKTNCSIKNTHFKQKINFSLIKLIYITFVKSIMNIIPLQKYEYWFLKETFSKYLYLRSNN